MEADAGLLSSESVFAAPDWFSRAPISPAYCSAQNSAERLQLLWLKCAQKVTKSKDVHIRVTVL
jgi:hypothetical protein